MDEIKSKHKDQSGNYIGGIILIGVGVLFLLVNFDVIPGLEDSWPIFIIIVGLAIIVGAMTKKKKTEEI